MDELKVKLARADKIALTTEWPHSSQKRKLHHTQRPVTSSMLTGSRVSIIL